MKATAIIVAAGSSKRYGGELPKQFEQLCGRPLLSWTISRFEKAKSIDLIVLVVAEENLLYVADTVVDPYDFTKVEKVIAGGSTRTESVFNGLKSLDATTGLVAIHDGGRPLVLPEDIDRVVESAGTNGAAILAQSATDTVKRVENGNIVATLNRDSLCLAQTPQVFQYEKILQAHQQMREQGLSATDDASLLESAGHQIAVVETASPNPKVTVKSDMIIVQGLMEAENAR